jgi:hypothetical protein
MTRIALLSLLLSGWMAAPAPQQPVSPSLDVRVAAPTYYSDGRVLGPSAHGWGTRVGQTLVVYQTTGSSLCESRPASTTAPEDAGDGWRVEITPIRENAGQLIVKVDWQRVWEAGRKLTDGQRGSAQLSLHPGDRVLVDYLSGGDRLAKGFNRIVDTTITPVQKPAGITGSNVPQPARLKLIRWNFTCAAIGMGLEIGLEPARTETVIEAELWLVRRQPDGKEQSQRQVVRVPLGQSPTSYSFNEEKLAQPPGKGQVLRVLGDLSVFNVADGKIHMNFGLSRSFDVVDAAGQMTTRSGGSTAYTDITAAPGEVLSFELPLIERLNASQLLQAVVELQQHQGATPRPPGSSPAPADRFSVRIRAQIVR